MKSVFTATLYILLAAAGAYAGWVVGGHIHDQLTEVRIDDYIATRILSPMLGAFGGFFVATIIHGITDEG